MARYNIAHKARTCTPAKHKCRRGRRGSRIVSCTENCCRSRYRRGASAAMMNNTIDPRKVLSESELDKTLRATRKIQEDQGVALRFISETGCRVGEALLVRKDSFLWQPGRRSIVNIPTLKKRDQGRPPRAVYLDNSSEIVKEVRGWWKKAKPGPIFRVPKRTLQGALERILKKIKPDRESLVHIFRHTRASRLLRAGASMAYVMHQMGWSSIEMARIYAHVEEKEIDEVFDKL